MIARAFWTLLALLVAASTPSVGAAAEASVAPDRQILVMVRLAPDH